LLGYLPPPQYFLIASLNVGLYSKIWVLLLWNSPCSWWFSPFAKYFEIDFRSCRFGQQIGFPPPSRLALALFKKVRRKHVCRKKKKKKKKTYASGSATHGVQDGATDDNNDDDGTPEHWRRTRTPHSALPVVLAASDARRRTRPTPRGAPPVGKRRN